MVGTEEQDRPFFEKVEETQIPALRDRLLQLTAPGRKDALISVINKTTEFFERMHRYLASKVTSELNDDQRRLLGRWETEPPVGCPVDATSGDSIRIRLEKVSKLAHILLADSYNPRRSQISVAL